MSSPRKRANTEAEEPLEYIERIREQATKWFVTTDDRKNKVNYDIEQNIREIRALLNINDEIFQRCISSGKIKSTSASFTRYSYDVVKVRQDPTNQTQTQFITEPEQSQKSFDMSSLLSLPADLSGVFVAKYQSSHSLLIDYNALLESSLIMHDDVLGPFLAKLKHHLETILYALGRSNAGCWSQRVILSLLKRFLE